MTGVPSLEPAETYDFRLDGASLDVAGEKRRALLDLFPEARTEPGSIDFDQLRRALGDAVDPGKERFGLTWPGKAACFKAIQTPSMATLLPLPEKSIDFDTTGNVIIEGDNLEVLKLLQKSYLGKVKMVYIDPPYNTGNDFIYPDDYSESLQTYLRYTGQIDDDGKRFSNNTDADGRFHSKWLNMIYPRLYLARNLLRSDGVFFISSGQTELSNLLAACDDIFGEVHRIAICTRLQKTGGQKGKFFSPNTDYVVVYARDISNVPDFRGALSDDLIRTVYTQIEVGGTRDGQRYRVMGLFQPTLDERRNQRFFIACPDGELVIPPGKTTPSERTDGSAVRPAAGDGVWRWTFKRFDEERMSGNLLFKQTLTSPLITADGKQSRWNIYPRFGSTIGSKPALYL
jgi:adenine-specific DNA-methyltransferase